MIAKFGRTLLNISLPNHGRVLTSIRLDDFLGLINWLHDYGKNALKIYTTIKFLYFDKN